AAQSMPKLPVASILWKPRPTLLDSAEAWILAGGAHHTAFSFVVTVEQLYNWSEMSDIECVIIDENTVPMAFKNELRLSDMAWRLRY
ncbi:MAG: L-arabinose isomerase, partial [Clostridiaceae bacterium]|nr:L-arabinose isomerase [Clostridiaceae bacterium]